MAWMWQASGGKGDFGDMMQMCMGMKGKGGGKGFRGQRLPKERVTTEQITGTIVKWGQHFGYIEPDLPFEHPQMSAKGQFYLHKRDIQIGNPAEGAAVAFHVYVDDKGVGAEECVISN